MDSRRYLAEEVALEFAGGTMSRREALGRLALMGLSASAASALLAACGGSGGATTASTASTPPRPTPAASAAGTETIEYAGRSGRLYGAWAPAPRPKGAVLVVHENRGLTDDIRQVAARLAGDGYSSLAVDLLSEEGGTQTFTSPDDATTALAQAFPDRFIADMRSSLDELERRAPGAHLGVIGFCFGGMLTWALLEAHEPRLAAAVPFYGTVSDNPDFTGDRAAVLAVYAGLDTRVNATRAAAEAALKAAGLTYRIHVFPDVNHAFFSPARPSYDRAAATQAYEEVLAWFGAHLG